MPLWVDSKSGYFYAEFVEGSVPINSCVGDLGSESINQGNLFRGEVCFVNCGGTIVSGPGDSYTGVKPVKNLMDLKEFRKFLIDKEVSYLENCLKLSQEWTPQDYLNLKNTLKKLTFKFKSFIFTHGTDYLSFFAPWVDLLSKELGFKGVICCSQRSLDRPTSELHLLLSQVLGVLKKMPSRNCFVLTYSEPQVLVHNPYEVTKYHTTSKTGFYSKHYTTVSGNLNHLKTTFLKPLTTIDLLSQCKSPQLGFETLFSTPNETQIRVSRGVANPKKFKVGEFLCTLVGAGPTNPYLYNGGSSPILTTRPFQFTWESLCCLKAFTNL